MLLLAVIEVHVQPVGGEDRFGQVGPLDARDGAVVELLEQRQIDYFAQPVQAIEVGVVAVDVGPGLFTGLRVGVATAKALAQALRVPMVGLSSLDLLAYRQRGTRRLIAAVIDARRGEVFSALYRKVPGGLQRVSEAVVTKAEEVAADLEARGEECLLVGDGAVRYAAAFSGVKRAEGASLEDAYPSAAALVELAQPRVQREEFVQPWELEPIYLRQADVDPHWDRRLAPHGGR